MGSVSRRDMFGDGSHDMAKSVSWTRSPQSLERIKCTIEHPRGLEDGYRKCEGGGGTG